MIFMIIMPFNVLATTNELCHTVGVLKALKVISYLIVIIKILIPVVLIITGMKSLLDAILNQDDKAISKAGNLFIKKFIIGAFIFFIPSIVTALMNYVSGYDKTKTKFSDCTKCVSSYKECNNLINKYK